MNMPERGEVPKAVLDKINTYLDNHKPPFNAEERQFWYDKAVENYWEGLEHGMVEGRAEVELAAMLSKRVSSKLYDDIVSDEFREALQTGDASSPERFKELFVTLMMTAFMKGHYMRYLLIEKDVKHHEELYRKLTEDNKPN